MSRFFTRTNLILAAITALAAFFRGYRLDQTPPGFQFDQAFYVFDALRLLQGQFHIFFAAPGGTEPLYIYLAMVGGALFGISPLGLKVTTTILGVVTIPLIFGLARTLFSPSPENVGQISKFVLRHAERRRFGVGVIAAFLAAISVWHFFFARYGERVVLLVLLTVLMYLFFWRALHASRTTFYASRFTHHASRLAPWQNYILTGLVLALALYTYPASRALPIALVLLTAYAALADRANAARHIKGLLIAFAVAAIIFLPLGIYFVLHPDQFISHTAEVSIFVPRAEEQGNVAAALVRNAARLLGMFFIVGDAGIIRNVPLRPVFDPFTAALFIAGVIVWLSALLSPRATSNDRQRAVFLGIWITVALAVSFFSDNAPNFGRTLPAMPAIMILPAWGAAELWERLRNLWARRTAAVVIGTILIAGAASSYRDYFIVFANDPELDYAFNADKVELADWLNQRASSDAIYVAPLTYQIGTISLLTRNAPLKSFESRDTIVLPSQAGGKDAVFGFPLEQEKKVQTLATRLGALGARDDLIGSNGAKLLLVYRVPAQHLPDPQNPLAALAQGGDFVKPQQVERAVWNDQMELLGCSIDAADAAKRNFLVTLFFHALKPMTEDYTFSVKARDAKDRVWGQEDKWAGDNSYATTQWSPGDVIIEKFYPGLDACAPADDYRITVEAYNPKTMQVLALSDRAGNLVELGRTRAEASPSNRLEDLAPEQTLDVEVAAQARLLGFTLPPDVRAGEAFALSLFWRGQSDGTATRRAEIRVRDATQRDFALAEKDIALPPEGRGLCTLFDLRAPAELAQGAGALFVNDVQIATINVER